MVFKFPITFYNYFLIEFFYYLKNVTHFFDEHFSTVYFFVFLISLTFFTLKGGKNNDYL